jgi:NarL family two-component system response regulator LiaR
LNGGEALRGFWERAVQIPQSGQPLIVSRSTVKFHVSNILSKLQATSCTEAVAVALQHSLVSSSS